jgi:hypothetical protein
MAVKVWRTWASWLSCSGERCMARMKAMPLSGGMFRKKGSRAFSPPDEAPRATTKKPEPCAGASLGRAVSPGSPVGVFFDLSDLVAIGSDVTSGREEAMKGAGAA